MAKNYSLQQKLNEQKNKIGLVGGSVEVNEYDSCENPFSAHITPAGWNITVNIRKGFNPIQNRRQKAYARKKGIANGLETMVMHVGGLHEPAHWELASGSEKGCPYNLYWHDKILEAIKEGLQEDKKSHADYVANAFEDMVINPRCKEYNKDFSGQVLFWDSEGFRASEKGQEGYNSFYEAFVKLNMHLWGDGADKALLKRHYKNEEKTDSAVKSVIDDLNLQEDTQDTTYLFQKNRWPNMARNFAKNLSNLLDEMPKERLSAFKAPGKENAGNGIDQEMGTRAGNEKIAGGRYASGDKQSANATSFEQLDALYRTLAKAIPINVEAMTREHGLKIAPLTYRPFDEETDDLRKMRASKIYVTDEGLKLAHPNQPLVVETNSKIQRRSFPPFKMVLIDNSGSMQLAVDGSRNIGSKSFIPWGDRSRYHYALLGHYGIENFLTEQQIAQYIEHGLSLFSSQTRFKEGSFQDLEEVRKFALNPDWGSTNIDAEALKSVLNGRESFVLSLSDGEIANWDSQKEEVRELTRQNYYAHIQIGGETDFTGDLQEWGVPISFVSSGEDLSRLMVDVTKQTYNQFIHEGGSK